MKKIKIHDQNHQLEVGKILCLGRNYVEHAKEMNAELPTSPVVFMKPSSALIYDGETIVRPKISNEMHHEVELVVVIGKNCKGISANNAYDHILGYAIGLDMTLRDIQADAKKKGLPWTIAKGFDTSAVISDVIPKSKIQDPHELTISCKVNGELRQRSSTSKMIFKIDKLIEYISTLFTLEQGDLIFTGTPEGVGEVKKGDIIEAELNGYIKISNPITTA